MPLRRDVQQALRRLKGELPSLDGAVQWLLNSPPLTRASLRGKVVVVDFWTYSCINCLRALPYVKSWYARYKDAGLVVIGVHAPEFAFEKDVANVTRAVQDLGITYPVALDKQPASSGGHSATSTGRRTISSMPRAESADITSVKASTANPKLSSASF